MDDAPHDTAAADSPVAAAPAEDAPARDTRPPPDPLFREAAGAVLREHRKRQGKRLVDAAERAGVSPQYLSEVERGVKDPSSEVLEAMAAAVGLDLDALLVDVVMHRRRTVLSPLAPRRSSLGPVEQATTTLRIGVRPGGRAVCLAA